MEVLVIFVLMNVANVLLTSVGLHANRALKT